MMEFNSFITQSGLIDISVAGSVFSWTNNQKGEHRIYKNLDRILVNAETLIKIPYIKSSYLPRIHSDHMPILVSMVSPVGRSSGFKFLRMWGDHEGFSQFVKDSWNAVEHEKGLVNLYLKLKHLKTQLSIWNKEVFGHVDGHIEICSQKVEELDDQLSLGWNEQIFRDLEKEKAQLAVWERRKYSLLEDKSRMLWLKGGDRNSKIFHAAIKDQARRGKIKLLLEDGSESDDPRTVGAMAVNFFSDLYKGGIYLHNAAMFECIPKKVSDENNDFLTTVPCHDEIKEAVFNLNPSSAPGPDGFSGYFYQSCWETIEADVVKAVQDFWDMGTIIPKGITAAHICLIPKIPNARSLKDLRPISLSNFSYKIISKILASRLAKILPGIISQEQAGFIQGRSILENIALAHEHVRDLNKKVRGNNLVLKLDLSKAYDRVKWSFS